MLSEAKARSFCGTPPAADLVEAPNEPLVHTFEHRKSNAHERGRASGVRTMQ